MMPPNDLRHSGVEDGRKYQAVAIVWKRAGSKLGKLLFPGRVGFCGPSNPAARVDPHLPCLQKVIRRKPVLDLDGALSDETVQYLLSPLVCKLKGGRDGLNGPSRFDVMPVESGHGIDSSLFLLRGQWIGTRCPSGKAA